LDWHAVVILSEAVVMCEAVVILSEAKDLFE
jgi:hypothetical protein